MSAPETENPLCVGFVALRGGLRPWSQTTVPKGPGVGVDPILLINGARTLVPRENCRKVSNIVFDTC